jgi:hypothetical protein
MTTKLNHKGAVFAYISLKRMTTDPTQILAIRQLYSPASPLGLEEPYISEYSVDQRRRYIFKNLNKFQACINVINSSVSSNNYPTSVGRDGAVNIATCYGLDGPAIESRWRHPDRPWGPPNLLHNGCRVSFLGVKRPGRSVNHPPHLVPRLKKEYNYTSTALLGLYGLLWVELYHFYPTSNSHQGY